MRGCASREVLEAIRKLEGIGYDRDEIADLPPSVICASGGCGNPVKFADIKEGEVVLDLGCGAGIDCFLAAKRVGQNGKVIGVDMSPDALRRAEENKRKLNASNVEFRLGKLEKLPLEDESVDVAISNCVGCVMAGEETVLREAFRVLKPGGRLVTTGGEALAAKLRAVGFERVSLKGNIVKAVKPG